MEYIPRVVQAVAGDDFTVYAYFTDGTVREKDMKPLLEGGGVFAPLRDPVFFRERITVMNETVAWDMGGTRNPAACVDLDPYNFYRSCPVVEDPLKD